jgi:hypothetical protein
MSGSGGAGGYDYQADAYAYVATHVVCGHRLGWFDDLDDTPTAVLSETGGPGDDLQIESLAGFTIELQAKYGLTRGERFDEPVRRLIRGLIQNPDLRCVLLVDSTTSGTIRDDFRGDVLRLADGRSDNLKDITRHVLSLFATSDGLNAAILRRFRVIVRDLAASDQGPAECAALLREVVADPTQTGTAWDILGKDGHRQMSHCGRRDAAALAQMLATHVPLKRDAKNLVVAAEGYRSWQLQTFGQFFVPGVGVTLPISEAWIRLRLLGDEREKSD